MDEGTDKMYLMLQGPDGSENKINSIPFHGLLQKVTMIICSYSTTELVLS